MTELLAFAQTASPLAVIALLGVVIFIQVWHKLDLRGSNKIATNHVSCLPEMIKTLDRIDATMLRIESEMGRQTNMLTEIRVKLNGKM